MHLSGILGIPLRLRCRRLLSRFVRAAEDPASVQERVLLDKLRRNADSDFGRKHDFDSIRSVEEFRRRLPLCDYEDVRPWIDRVKRGNPRALFGPSEEVLMFAVTSGTESEPKFIPVTGAFLREYELGWHIWGGSVDERHHPAWDHTICRIVSPMNESYSEGGIPCGAISGLITEGLPWYIRHKYVPPIAAAAVRSAPAKYYAIARLAVACNVSMLSSANPSTVLAVVRAADENRDRIVRDVHDGALDGAFDVPPETRRRLAPWLRPQRRRAKELERIVRRTGRLLPKDYWRELELVANWKGGACGIYLARYGEYFGDTPVRDIGLLASEGRMTIPLSDDGASGVLDVASHFFEFIPEAEMVDKSTGGNACPTTLLAHELREGENYVLVVTTSGGLYRYNIGDLVRVTGFVGRTPQLAFLNKGSHISSVTGEKVSEHQVVEGLSRTRAALGWGPLDGIWSPMTGDPPRYSLAVEPPDGVARGRREWREFLAEFDRRLCALNVEYESRRASGRLGDPVLHLLLPGAFDRLRDSQIERARGRREQYKHRFVTPELDYHRKLPVADTIPL